MRELSEKRASRTSLVHTLLKATSQFDLLREHLRSFPDLDLESADYEDAAFAFNRCREKRFQGSNTDFLLWAVARRRGLAIYTADGDFRHYAKVLELALHEPRT